MCEVDALIKKKATLPQFPRYCNARLQTFGHSLHSHPQQVPHGSGCRRMALAKSSHFTQVGVEKRRPKFVQNTQDRSVSFDLTFAHFVRREQNFVIPHLSSGLALRNIRKDSRIDLVMNLLTKTIFYRLL